MTEHRRSRQMADMVAFAIMIGTATHVLAQTPEQMPVQTLDDCDCSVKLRSCASSGLVENVRWKYSDADGVDELHWDVRISSSESRLCSFVKTAVAGHAGANADTDMGTHGIYRRIVVGMTVIKDYQRVTRSSTVETSGLFGDCYVCGSKAAARAAEAVKQQAAEQAKIAALRYNQLLEKAKVLAGDAGEQLDHASSVAGERLSSTHTTQTSTYQRVLDNQEEQAANASNQVLQGAVMSAVESMAAQRGNAFPRMDGATKCQQLVDEIASQRQTLVSMSTLTSAEAAGVRRLGEEAIASNQQMYDRDCR